MIEGRALSQVRTSGLVLVAFAWALFLSLIGSPEAILFTIPVFLLAAPLAFGRYVGEELLAAARALGRRRLRAPAPAFTLPDPVPAVRGLLDAALAHGRAPPLAS